MLLTEVARRERSWETRTREPGKEERYFPSQSLALESSFYVVVWCGVVCL